MGAARRDRLHMSKKNLHEKKKEIRAPAYSKKEKRSLIGRV